MKLNFMLIDDNEIDLFVNQRFIEKEVKETEIITFIRAKKAITYLKSLKKCTDSDYFIPDIVLVDINMPEMNGFGFLNAIAELSSTSFQKTNIYILSSSTNLKDIIDAEKHSACRGFISKPLTRERIQQIVNESLININQS